MLSGSDQFIWLGQFVLLGLFVLVGRFVLFCWVIRFVGSVRFVWSGCFCFGGSVRFVGSVRLVGSVDAINVRHVKKYVHSPFPNFGGLVTFGLQVRKVRRPPGSGKWGANKHTNLSHNLLMSYTHHTVHAISVISVRHVERCVKNL